MRSPEKQSRVWIGRYLPSIIAALGLITIIVAIWCWVYHRTTIEAWRTPLLYGGDATAGLAVAKAYADGDIAPFLLKSVEHLNAPFAANWNDYPMTDEFIFAAMGWLGRVSGLFASSNIIVLLAHILAGLSFWWVGTTLRYRPVLIFVGAVLFAFSHFIFIRNLPHITLIFCWHIPLFLLVSWWTFSRDELKKFENKRFWIAIAISFITGIFNPYYSSMFLQFLSFAALLHIVRRQWRETKVVIILGGITVFGFLIMNMDTFIYRFLHGPNGEAVVRNLAGLEIYGLKIPELFMPPGYHRWHSWADFGAKAYFNRTAIRGEMWSPYLGFAGAAGLLWLGGLSFYRLLQGRFHAIPVQAWQILWILLYSLIGGINLLIGTFGLILFRGTNRYSVIILAISLLFLVRQLSHYSPRKLAWPIGVGLLALGLWDQLPPQTSNASIHQTRQVIESDRAFVGKMESVLPADSMVFQLPVMDFPEVPPIHKMGDYQHFRPYLFSEDLHFSYGSDKGRPREAWQHVIEKLPPAQLVEKLEEYGFDAIYINRKGYSDRGKHLVEELKAINRPILAESALGDLLAIKLFPSAAPVLPAISSPSKSKTKTIGELRLKNGENVVLHTGFRGGNIGNGVELKALSLNADFSIEIVVKPLYNQVAYAGIIGNHPGYNYYEGFVVQQDGNNQNVYTFGYGNGKEWAPGVRFKLTEGEWAYVAIIVENSNIKVYKNGILIISAKTRGSIANSTMPICIGNWINNDRPFNGLVDEVRILSHVLSDEEVKVNCSILQERLKLAKDANG